MRNLILSELSKFDVKDTELLIKYVDFCIDKNSEQTGDGYEKHHILPKSLVPKYSDLTLNPWNSSILNYEDHYTAHQLLALALNEKSTTYAWWNMSTLNKGADYKKINSKEYKILREKHHKIVSEAQHLRNKNPEIIQRRKESMLVIGDDGLTTFERQGLKISKSLKENGSVSGEKNGCYKKVIIKDRKDPTKRHASTYNFDRKNYINVNCKFLKLFDNENNLYFSGWIDECRDYCESIGLDPTKIPARGGDTFVYKGTNNNYLVKTMKRFGLGKYLNGYATVIDDENVKQYLDIIDK
jgi:hypothetical protein